MPARHAPQCQTCRHREAAGINLALARGVSVAALSKRFGISTDAIYRHLRSGHLPPQLRAKLLQGPDCEVDLDRLRESESQSLLANLVALRRRLFAALDLAEEHADGFLLTRVSSQLHVNLETTARLLGDLGTGNTTVNILVAEQYVNLRVALVGALAPYPEARAAVAQVLHAAETKAAADIAADDRRLAQ